MNEGKEFNHIKITPPQEEDVVIHAGTSRSVDPMASADVGPDAAPIASDIASDEPAPIHAASPSVRSDSGKADGDSSNADARSRSKKAAKQYKETTLEDIESSKMSTTQKVIIVIAILAVIAFAVYTAVNS